jgi:hypothetical protein
MCCRIVRARAPERPHKISLLLRALTVQLVVIASAFSFAQDTRISSSSFRRAFLIGTVVLDSSEVAKTPSKEWHGASEFLYYIVGGASLGAQPLWKGSIELPSFWHSKISAIYSFQGDNLGEYESIIAIAELRVQELPVIAKLGQGWPSCIQDELFRSIFAGWKQRVVIGTEHTNCEYASLLYLEPHRPISINRPEDTRQPGVSALLRELGYSDQTVCVPSMVIETILDCGLESNWSDLSALAIRSKPMPIPGREDVVPISDVALNVVGYFAILEALNQTDKTISNVPLAKLNVDQYLEQRLGLGSGHATISSRYQQFLQDRQRSTEERFKANTTLERVKAQLYYYRLADPNLKTFSLPAIPHDNLWQRDYFWILRDLSTGAITRTGKMLDEVASRESVLADYLRDATTAEATIANLELQRRVESLTWTALTIALVGLIVGLVPEDKKRGLARLGVRAVHKVGKVIRPESGKSATHGEGSDRMRDRQE